MGNAAPSGDELTTRQVHDLTGWSITSINRWAGDGLLPSRKLPGHTGSRLFRREDIEKLASTRKTTQSVSA